MDYSLRGRVALVNAASKGIGRAIAEALAAEGVRLVISARNGEALARTATEIAAAQSQQVVPVAADVAQAGTAERLVGEAVARFGRLDILVNHSGGPPAGPFADPHDAGWQAALAFLLLSGVRVGGAAVRRPPAAVPGRVVDVG